MKTIERIKTNLNPSLEIRGILLTMFDKRNKLSGQVEIEARNYFKEKVYSTVIPRNVRLSEAPSHGIPVLLYDKICPGSKSYFNFTDEFLNQDKQVEVLLNPFNKKGLGRGLSSLIGDSDTKISSNKISVSSIIPKKTNQEKNLIKRL